MSEKALNDVASILKKFVQLQDDNTRLRAKYPDEPIKFAANETELYAVLEDFKKFTAQPEIYQSILKQSIAKRFVSLISHPNDDIIAQASSFLDDLMSPDPDIDYNLMIDVGQELKREYLDGLVVEKIGATKFNDESSQPFLISSLSLLDNLIDLDSANTEMIAKDLLRPGLKFFKLKKFSSVKLAFAELFCQVHSNMPVTWDEFATAGGVKIVLEEIARFRLKKPSSVEEREYLEQILLLIESLILTSQEVAQKFLDEEGVQLMILILNEKKSPTCLETPIKLSALKILNAVTSSCNEDSASVSSKACEIFIEQLGLRVIFPIFMNHKILSYKTLKKNDYARHVEAVEEHTAIFIKNLLTLTKDTQKIQRILLKFGESGFEKLSRLVTLHQRIYQILTESGYFGPQQLEERNLEEIESMPWYTTLISLDYILILTCYLSSTYDFGDILPEPIIEGVNKILKNQPGVKDQVITVMKRYAEHSASETMANSIGLCLEHFESLSNQ